MATAAVSDLPPQMRTRPVFDHVDDPADDTMVVDPGQTSRTWEVRRQPLYLNNRKQYRMGHRTPPIPYESYRIVPRKGS